LQIIALCRKAQAEVPVKKILIIDEADLIRSFLVTKLGELGFETEEAQNGLDGLMKIRNFDPDLVIMDYYLSRMSAAELLEKKAAEPNIRDIPVLFASGKISRQVILELSRYGIRKFITKPIKIDSLVKAISELLDIRIELDNTPCIIDANYNEEILFIEVARGLNNEKIELLRYRLQELIKLYHIEIPRVLLMLTGLEITEADSLKLPTLIDGIVSSTGVMHRNFKILTAEEVVKNFVQSRSDISSIEVLGSMPEAMEKLLGSRAGGYSDEHGNIHEDFLRVGEAGKDNDDGINLRFQSESDANTFSFEAMASSLKMAIVDDDFVIRELIKTAFSHTGLSIETFSDGDEFVRSEHLSEFDLVFLDLLMPSMDGFQVLQTLEAHGVKLPIIVLSAVNKRETVVEALQKGVKSYLVKPIQPDMVYKKALEIFQLNF
jgi:CheY-like chemotaxis protein